MTSPTKGHPKYAAHLKRVAAYKRAKTDALISSTDTAFCHYHNGFVRAADATRIRAPSGKVRWCCTSCYIRRQNHISTLIPKNKDHVISKATT